MRGLSTQRTMNNPSRSASVFSDVSTSSFSIPGIRGPPLRSGSVSSTFTQGRVQRSSSSNYGKPKLESETTAFSGSKLTNFPLHDPENPWICAISEGKSTGKELGVAMRNMDTGHCCLSQFADTTMYGHLTHMLDSRSCKTILLPGSHGGQRILTNNTKISEDPLRQMLKQAQKFVVDLPRKVFDGTIGQRNVEKFMVSDNFESERTIPNESVPSLQGSGAHFGATLAALSQKYYAFSAFAALIWYMEESLCENLIPHSLFVQYSNPEGTVLVDTQSAKDLELVCNAINKKQMGSLLGMLDSCSTPMGERLLRMNILQPLADPISINFRLDAVEEITQNPELFFELRESLKGFTSRKIDIDKIIALLLSSAKRITNSDAKAVENSLQGIIQLWTSLSSLRSVYLILKHANPKSLLLQTIAPMFSNERLDTILEKIEECIDMTLLDGSAKSNLASKNVRLFAVKTGNDSILDAARRTYTENTSDALELCQNLIEKYELPLKPVCVTGITGGYTLEVSASLIRVQDLPRDFINISKKKGGKVISFTTIELKKINQRIIDSSTEVFLLSEEVVECLRLQILRDIGHLYKASEATALADVIVSLSHYALSGDHVRPQFGEELVIKEGRHPLLNYRDQDSTIPNDTEIRADKSFVILNGPNNSGKTTYLKQVALLVIMAHIGCFVPAMQAIFYPVQHVFSRLSNRDEAEANLSTFANEMKCITQIIQCATASSIVLIDELGRNTSTHEGIGIAHAVSEALIRKEVPTIFATHFMQLNATLSPYGTVKVQQFSVDIQTDKKTMGTNLVYEHRLSSKGENKRQHYGIALAKTCQLPQDILQDAEDIVARMQIDVKAGKASEGIKESTQAIKRKHDIFETVNRLKEFLRNSLNTLPDDVREFLLEEQKKSILSINDSFAKIENLEYSRMQIDQENEEFLFNSFMMEFDLTDDHDMSTILTDFGWNDNSH